MRGPHKRKHKPTQINWNVYKPRVLEIVVRSTSPRTAPQPTQLPRRQSYATSRTFGSKLRCRVKEMHVTDTAFQRPFPAGRQPGHQKQQYGHFSRTPWPRSNVGKRKKKHTNPPPPRNNESTTLLYMRHRPPTKNRKPYGGKNRPTNQRSPIRGRLVPAEWAGRRTSFCWLLLRRRTYRRGRSALGAPTRSGCPWGSLSVTGISDGAAASNSERGGANSQHERVGKYQWETLGSGEAMPSTTEDSRVVRAPKSKPWSTAASGLP